MYTLLFFISAMLAFIILLKSQPAGRRTIFEPGVVIVGLFSLCYLLPALAITFGGNILPSVNMASVELVSLYGFVFMLAFLFFYKTMKVVSRVRVLPPKSISIRWSPKSYFIGFILFFVITRMIFAYYGVRDSGDYTEQYIVRRSIPQIIAQSLNLLNCFQWMFIYLLLLSSFVSSARKRSWCFLWITAFILFYDMWLSNSRSLFVTFVIVFIAAYIFHNRPIGLKKELVFAFLFILIMSVFSFKRVASDSARDIDFIDILIPGEFISVYRNATHLMSLSGTPDFVQPPGSSYLQSLIAFIPKQFNAGKWDLSTWYVREYFLSYYEAGGGLAFGIIPEALVNWGLISMVFQAFIIAAVFRVAYFSACRTRFSSSDIRPLFYLFSFSIIYHLIRSNSFSIFSGMFLGFIVPFLTLFILSRIKVTSRRYKNVQINDSRKT